MCLASWLRSDDVDCSTLFPTFAPGVLPGLLLAVHSTSLSQLSIYLGGCPNSLWYPTTIPWMSHVGVGTFFEFQPVPCMWQVPYSLPLSKLHLFSSVDVHPSAFIFSTECRHAYNVPPCICLFMLTVLFYILSIVYSRNFCLPGTFHHLLEACPGEDAGRFYTMTKYMTGLGPSKQRIFCDQVGMHDLSAIRPTCTKKVAPEQSKSSEGCSQFHWSSPWILSGN